MNGFQAKKELLRDLDVYRFQPEPLRELAFFAGYPAFKSGYKA